MANPVTLSIDDGMIRLKTTYEIDMEGLVTIDVLIPNADRTVLEMQAMACDFAAAALTRRATYFRQLTQDEKSTALPE